MRRAIAIVWLAVLCQSWIMAQTRIPREVHLGVIGGANLSDYTFQPRVRTQLTDGVIGGVAIRYIEETYFGLQAELLLTQRGFSDFFEPPLEGQPDPFPGIRFSRTLTYVEVPIMAHVYFPMGKHNEIAFDAGPKLGYFLSDKVDSYLPEGYGTTGEYQGNVYLHHELPIVRKFDYGIQAGLGYEFKFGEKMSLMLQGRYYYGLGNLWPDTKADDFEVSNNQSIQIVMSLWWHHVIRGKKVRKSEKGY